MGLLTARTGLLVAFLLALAACGEDPDVADPPSGPRDRAVAPSVEAEVPADAPVVAFLGDSLSAGMHLSAHEAFPAVIQRTLATTGVPFRLVNAGVSGNTTAAGLARVDWILKRDPDIVVVQLGANDGFRGLALEATEKNLRGIVAKVKAHGATPLLLGMKLPPNYGEDYTRRFEAIYARLAEEEGVSFVPFFMHGVAGVPAMNLADGIHPTAAGHRQLAKNLAPHLQKLLQSTSVR